MSDLSSRLKNVPGPALGLVGGLALGLLTGSILLWVPVGFLAGLVWDKRKQKRGY